MTSQTIDRWFTVRNAFDPSLVRGTIETLATVLVAFPIGLSIADRASRVPVTLSEDLWDRYRSWLVLIPLMFAPVLLGAAATIAAVGVLSLLCYREFARATGLFRWTATSATVVLGIGLITFAVADHWYGLFVAVPPLWIGLIAATALLADDPTDYIQRVSLGTFAFLLFGVCLGHLGYLANDGRYRSILVWLVVSVECNDVFAYATGKAIGGPKLAPNTSPHKTVGGAVGALLCTSVLSTLTGRVGLAGTGVASWGRLTALGIIVSVAAQLGDLTLSSVKRNLGIKDWGVTFPGHGGLLDRFNSLLFAAPAALHFIGYLGGIGLDQPTRIFSGN